MTSRVSKGVVLMVGALLFGLCHADTLSKIRDTHAIVIAHRENSIPFSYLDTDKRPIGYAVDICKQLANAIKDSLKLRELNVNYLLVTPATRIAAIVDGKADLECGSTTNNAERRQQVAFTISHFVASSRMLVRSSSGIKNWPDLHDRTVVTTIGTTNAKTLNERNKVRTLNIHLIEARDHGEAFAMVLEKKADAFAMDDVLLYSFRANAANPADFRIVGDPLSVEPYAIMLGKNDLPFKHLVDAAMANLINTGEIARLYEKWFLKPIPPTGVNLNMPMSHLLRDSFQFPGSEVAD